MPSIKPVLPLLGIAAIFALIVLVCVSLIGCGSKPPVATIQDVKPVNVKPIKESVVVVKQYTNDARKEIALAKREAEDARLEAEDAKALVEAMKAAQSPYHLKVAELRDSYEGKIKRLQEHIQETDRILAMQEKELLETDNELDKALTAAAVANQSNQLLISSNKALKKKADDGAKYKSYYESRWERNIKIVGITTGIILAVVIAFCVWQWFSNPLGATKWLARGLLFQK